MDDGGFTVAVGLPAGTFPPVACFGDGAALVAPVDDSLGSADAVDRAERAALAVAAGAGSRGPDEGTALEVAVLSGTAGAGDSASQTATATATAAAIAVSATMPAASRRRPGDHPVAAISATVEISEDRKSTRLNSSH